MAIDEKQHINMGHIKLTVERVKKWVLRLYPLYKNSTEFDVLYSILPEGSTPATSDKAIQMTESGTAIRTDEFAVVADDRKIALADSNANIRVLNTAYNKYNILGWIGAGFKFILRDGSVKLKSLSKTWFNIDVDEPLMEIEATSEFHMKENGTSSSLDIKNGNLYIENAGLIIDKNAPASRTEGGNTYYIYNGSDWGLGNYTGKSTASGVSIPYGQWDDWKKISGYEVTGLSSGVYTVTCSLGAKDAAVKARAVGVRAVWSHGSTNTVIEETQAVSTSNGSLSAEHIVTSCGVVVIPYGNENNTIYLEGFQRYTNSAYTNGRAAISVTKIA